MKKLLVVDKQDRILREASWEECHGFDGLLHRGFTVFVINNKNEILLQKRSKYKPLWPLFWDGSCSSHPVKGETYVKGGERRLKEEMGFTCKLKYLFKFEYHVKYKNKGSENEICAILLGRYGGRVDPEPKEVAEYKWMKFEKLREEVEQKPDIFAPWFRMVMKKIKNL